MRIAPGGVAVAAVPAVVGAVAAVTEVWPVAAACAGLALAVLAFYRDPERRPAGPGVLAPADGRVHEIGVVDGRVTVAIFLNVLDVHVVRAPAAGEVGAVERVAGHRRPAFLATAAANAGVRVETGAWDATLRAGLLARRVRAYVAPGDALARGERVGHIAFGSRVDVRLPPGVAVADLAVAGGDRVRAGETVLVPGETQ